MTSVTAKLTRQLGELGDNKFKVATYLDANNIRGKRGNAWCCPIITWIRQRFPMFTIVHTGKDTVCLSNGRFEDAITVPLPTAVAEFVKMFDDGEYPGLETEEST